ncbi:protein phosphatase 1 regulatory subunit 7-like [Argopecten irradians]|uniref:protein phosphatase 1 regulatory subunit 7-like n=1 Tax=Argopecten irradians TaxID=31199 RepID=UPI00371E3C99
MALSQEFVDHHTHPLSYTRSQWRLDLQGALYELDLKMCQLKTLTYDFSWAKDSAGATADVQRRIIKIDLSLNELTALEHDGFVPFKNVRELNASLNRITKFSGVEVFKHLYTLNLSHNSIKRVENIVAIPSLVELNLSMNELRDISLMPSLINLEILNVSNNKLESLDGIQGLPKLKELYAQRNEIRHILPLTGCFHLQVLNVSSNSIHVLHTVVGVLSQLKQLEVLNMHGNVVDRDPMYQNDILKNSNIMTLDNIPIRPLPRQPVPSYDSSDVKHKKNIESLKQAAQQAFEERMKESKQNMQENVRFLQKRILDLQDEYTAYDAKLRNDLDACLRYLDSLSIPDLSDMDKAKLRDEITSPEDGKFWHGGRRSKRPKERRDYSDIKKTDELLRFAKQELGKYPE